MPASFESEGMSSEGKHIDPFRCEQLLIDFKWEDALYGIENFAQISKH